jgi:NAD(P)H dehydrogenase (quinone)
MILVTGATGQLGGAAVGQLLKTTAPDELAVLARDGKKAQHYIDKGVNVRIGDFDDEESLEQAMKGISKLLLIPTIAPHRLEQHKKVIDAALKNGVKHVIYPGVSFKNIETSATAGLDAHFKTEDYIRNSGLTYTFLRNTLYMEAIAHFGGERLFESGFFLPAGNGKVPFALRREMGEAAANVLLQEGHENKTYDITGHELYGFAEVADELAKLTGKSVSYTSADPAVFAEKLKSAGVDEFFAFVVTGFNLDIRNRQFEIVTNDLERLLGRKPVGLKEGLTEVFGL